MRHAACVLALTFLALLGRGAARADDPKPATPAPVGSVARGDYPAAWFAPLGPDVKKASWEIAPDDAKAGEAILSKRTELGVFSNFAATPFELDGKKYASVEGFWQAMWYPENADDPRSKEGLPHTRAAVEAMTAFDAKRAGDEAKKKLSAAGIKWMTYGGKKFEPKGSKEDQAFHLELVTRAMKAKLDQNARVKELLLKTGDLVLRADHRPSSDATPAHAYYDIWMKLRAELKKAP